jgi:hypothetical protein
MLVELVDRTIRGHYLLLAISELEKYSPIYLSFRLLQHIREWNRNLNLEMCYKISRNLITISS